MEARPIDRDRNNSPFNPINPIIDNDGITLTHAVLNANDGQPIKFKNVRSDVVVTVVDMRGKVVRTYDATSETVQWDGKNDQGEQVASGVDQVNLKSHRDGSASRHKVVVAR